MLLCHPVLMLYINDILHPYMSLWFILNEFLTHIYFNDWFFIRVTRIDLRYVLIMQRVQLVPIHTLKHWDTHTVNTATHTVNTETHTLNTETRRVLLWHPLSVCCSMLQRAAVCSSVLQCVAVCFSVLQCVAVCCSVCPRSPVIATASNHIKHRSSSMYSYMALPLISISRHTYIHKCLIWIHINMYIHIRSIYFLNIQHVLISHYVLMSSFPSNFTCLIIRISCC